jgi:hypothetical protein
VAHSGEHSITEIRSRDRFGFPHSQQRGHLAKLGDLALCFRRSGEVRLESPSLVGLQRPESVRGGEILGGVLVGMAHGPRSK